MERTKKILVIRLSSLGDIVHSTSVLEPLKQAGCEISYITKAAFAPLLQGHPMIRSVYRYDVAASGSEERARDALFAWIEKENFDAILDLHDSLRTRFWRRRLRKHAPIFVAKKERLREWLILFFRLKKTFSFGAGGRAKKMRALAYEALDYFQIPYKDLPMCTGVALDIVAFEKMEQHLPKEKFAVLVPGSAWKSKEWPFYAELAKKIARSQPVIVLGGSGDTACEAVALAALEVNPRSINFQGKTSLAESVAVIAKAALVVGNDTGLLQVAESFGVRCFVIEGPTAPEMGFSVYKDSSKSIGLDLFCRPCSKTGRVCWRLGQRTCLKALTPERVMEDVRTHL